jgi:predicted RNA-binding protein with RPS1 domain
MSAVPEDVQMTPVETPAAPANGAGTNGTAAVAAAQNAAAPPAAVSPNAAPQSDFESMFKDKELSEGDVVVGTVVHIDKDGVLVDVGAKSEGMIRPNELSREPYNNIEDVVQVGESIKVVVIGRDTEDGSLLLSKKRADFEKAWDRVIEAMNDGTILHAMVTERVKGGLVVDLGIRGFIPASHVGQSIPIKVIEVDRERRKVVLSNKQATEEERRSRKDETLTSLKEGDVRKGIVRRVTDYGAFVDLGGIDGLLHVSEMSWARIKHPSEVVRNGQELDVVVLKLRLDQGRISLGLRQILPDPWIEIGEKYKVGDTVKVTISRLVPFGAFVALPEGVEAIIPNSELSDRRSGRPADVLNAGDEVEARVIEMRTDERKMTLSIRRILEDARPREPFIPEPEIPGGVPARGGGGRDRDRGRDREIEGGFAPREGGATPAVPSNRERRRREGGGGAGRGRGGEYNIEAEDDYREYKNYRANQREETFGTSLADVLGAQLSSLRAATEESEEATEDTTSAAEETTSEEEK